MKELIGVYTAEMARKDYEENNLVIKNSKKIIALLENRIRERANEGKSSLCCIFNNSPEFKQYIPYINQYLKSGDYNFGIFSDRERKDFCISIKWS